MTIDSPQKFIYSSLFTCKLKRKQICTRTSSRLYWLNRRSMNFGQIFSLLYFLIILNLKIHNFQMKKLQSSTFFIILFPDIFLKLKFIIFTLCFSFQVTYAAETVKIIDRICLYSRLKTGYRCESGM